MGHLVNLIWFICLAGLPAAALPQEVSSTRISDYEWECQDASGARISGHTRQDKAFQRCYNEALDTGETFRVVGGSYRVKASQPESAELITPLPPVADAQPPEESVLISFGPEESPTIYPSEISVLSRANVRWDITFTLADVETMQGLASRDERGQREGGHLTVWVEGGVVHVRNQDVAGGRPSVKLTSATVIKEDTQYTATIIISDAGLVLQINGVTEGTSSVVYQLDRNNLPLVVGASCTICDENQGPHYPASGPVELEIYALEVLPVINRSLMLSWVGPTERVDGTALGVNEIATFILKKDNVEIASVDGDAWQFEVTNLDNGKHCFTVQAVDIHGLTSENSNIACKTI